MSLRQYGILDLSAASSSIKALLLIPEHIFNLPHLLRNEDYDQVWLFVLLCHISYCTIVDVELNKDKIAFLRVMRFCYSNYFVV